MNTIKCSVGNCSFYKNGICYADSINIVGYGAEEKEETCCGSFLDKRCYSTLTNNTNGGGSCKILVCKADECKHNKNQACMLDDIQVDGNDVNIYSETYCSSFCSNNE